VTEEEIVEQATKLIQRFDNTRIIGSGGEWSGGTRQGFMFNPRPKESATTIISGACCFPDGSCSETTRSNCETLGGIYQGDGTVCSPGLCPSPTEGACCLADGVCVVETEAQCISDGGVFQGVGTDCTPNPCPGAPTGACCHGEICDIETQSDCEGSGGFYLGDGTTCEPNPCTTCSCYFVGFLSVGRYLTAQMHCEGSYDISGSNSTSDWTADATTIIDPHTCDVTCTSFSGSGSVTKTGGVGGPCSGSFTASSCFASSCTCSGNCAFSLPTVSSAPHSTGSYLQWDYSGDPACENLWGCTNFNWAPFAVYTTFSDTVQQITWNGTGPGGSSWSVTTTITLSDPCTPP